MIEFKNITKRYDNLVALKNVSFQVPSSMIVGLIGANGAGKTTSLRLLSQLLKPDSGEICVDGERLERITTEKYNIAYIPDDPVYYEFMSVNEHFDFISSIFPDGCYEVEELISLFSLEECLDKFPHTLSRGNKQKLMICIAIMREFDYLVADEPFNGLDPVQIKVFENILIELRNQGKGVLLSTHLLDIADKFCDRYVMINKGEIMASGTKEEIAADKNVKMGVSLEELYLSIKPSSRPKKFKKSGQ